MSSIESRETVPRMMGPPVGVPETFWYSEEDLLSPLLGSRVWDIPYYETYKLTLLSNATNILRVKISKGIELDLPIFNTIHCFASRESPLNCLECSRCRISPETGNILDEELFDLTVVAINIESSVGKHRAF
jgi:hypothetical protein